MAFPEGTGKEWEAVLAEFSAEQRNEADMECFRKIKELVMPKDLEVIGIYRASQHTPSPDLFIPLVIGQNCWGMRTMWYRPWPCAWMIPTMWRPCWRP